MREVIGLIGNGGHANEVESYTPAEVKFRAVHKQFIGGRALVDVENPPHEYFELPVHVAVGSPYLRKKLVEVWKGENFISIISPYAILDNELDAKEGCLIAPSAVVTTQVKLGRHAIINVAASIQHDSLVGNFATIGPGARIGGHVSVGDGAFLGLGSNVINNISIAPGVILGAGSTLIEDAIIENGVYVGSPARCIKVNTGWLREI